MSFVRFVFLIQWFDGFLENFTEVRIMFETFLGQRICSYVGELELVPK